MPNVSRCRVVEHHRHDTPCGRFADYVRDPEPTEPGPVMVNNDDASLHFISEFGARGSSALSWNKAGTAGCLLPADANIEVSRSWP